MPGQATPPRLVEPFAKNATACTASAPVAGGKTAPFPVTTQAGVTPGAASLDDGFTNLNMTSTTSNGVPPYGVDMNGIMFIVSSWAAFFAAGQVPVFDATLATAMGGYAVGARLQQTANANAYWINQTSGNTVNPDGGTPTGWLSTVPLYSAAALSGVNNVVLPGVSDYVIDIGSAAGPFTGFVPQRDGQKITFVNTSGGVVSFNALSGSSSGANQIQASGNIDVANNDSFSIQYSAGFGKWLVV